MSGNYVVSKTTDKWRLSYLMNTFVFTKWNICDEHKLLLHICYDICFKLFILIKIYILWRNSEAGTLHFCLQNCILKIMRITIMAK